MDGARPLRRLEAAVEDGEMFFFEAGSSFDGAGRIDVADDIRRLLAGVAELEERCRDGIVNDFDHAAADQLLVFHQCQIGLDAGGVAIHHEANSASGREHRNLRIAVAVLLAVGEGIVPNFF